MTESEFMMDQTPIYARTQKKRGPNLAMLAIPAAVIATGAIVFATSQPRGEPPPVAEENGPQLSSTAAPAAMTPAATPAPVVRAPAGVAPVRTAAAPAPTVRTRTAAANQTRRTVASEPAEDANSAAAEASAIVAPTPAPAAPAPVMAAEPAPVVAAPAPVAVTPQPEAAPEATPEAVAPVQPVQ